MMRRVLPLALLVMGANAYMLVAVAVNRSSDASRVVMTERELPLQARSERDSAVKLVLRYEEPVDWWKGRDGEVMRALGFSCATPLLSDLNIAPCGLGRRVFAAFEYDGPAWQAIAAKRLRDRDELLQKSGDRNVQSQADYLEQLAKHGTHLVLVDASLDPEALRRAHPDPRVIILPADVRAWLYREPPTPSGSWVLRGRIAIVTTELIAPVAQRWVPPPGKLEYRAITPPRYAVVLKVGRRHEPWVEAVTPIDSPETPR